MTIPFAGAAKTLGPNDIASAAESIGCDVAALKAVLTVETEGQGGFLPDHSGRPRILFEAHLFGAATKHVHDSNHPTISTKVWNRRLYKGGAAEYTRLAEAVKLDRKAALESASWGLFQVLGQHARHVGYVDVEQFVVAMAESEFNQLAAFLRFVVRIGADAALREHDWDTFARHYNGPSFRLNKYDTRLAAAHAAAQTATA